MRDILIACEDCECVFCDKEDECCQTCENVAVCKNKCSKDKCPLMKYKEKIYSDDEFLVRELVALTERRDLWLPAVAAERIKELLEENKKLRETLEGAELWL